MSVTGREARERQGELLGGEREGEGRGRRQERTNEGEGHLYRFPEREGEAAPGFGFQQIYHSRVGSGLNLRSLWSGSIQLSAKVGRSVPDGMLQLELVSVQIAWSIGWWDVEAARHSAFRSSKPVFRIQPPILRFHTPKNKHIDNGVARELCLSCLRSLYASLR